MENQLENNVEHEMDTRESIRVRLGLLGLHGIMEKNMETTIMSCIGFWAVLGVLDYC